MASKFIWSASYQCSRFSSKGTGTYSAHSMDFSSVSQLDDLVLKYVRGIECVCTGLVSWHFQVDRHFGENFTAVSDKLVADLLPKGKNALAPAHQLRYDEIECRIESQIG